jgi:DNA-binding NtrC family response regulator
VQKAAPRDPVQRATPGDPVGGTHALRQATADFERAHILRVIDECGGNKRKAARLLGLGVTSLYRKLGVAGAAPADRAD